MARIAVDGTWAAVHGEQDRAALPAGLDYPAITMLIFRFPMDARMKVERAPWHR